MTRVRAAASYLLATCLVATLVFLPIYFFWYPGALFDRAGGRELFTLIVGVDLVVGPILVLILYKPGKRGLAFDLATVAVLQLTALSYGVYVLFESRPAYIAFVKDRFELVRAIDIAPEDLAEAEPGPYARRPWTGPELVGARLPTRPDEQLRLIHAALAGMDVHKLPKYYVPYAEVVGQVKKRAERIGRLRTLNPAAGPRIDRLVARHGGREDRLRFLPMRAGPEVDLTALVDASTGELLDMVALKPWEFD